MGIGLIRSLGSFMACGVPNDMYTQSLMVFNCNGRMAIHSCFKLGKSIHHRAGMIPWSFHLKRYSTVNVVVFSSDFELHFYCAKSAPRLLYYMDENLPTLYYQENSKRRA